MTSDKSPLHPVYAAMGTTIFDAMSGLARDLDAINLGQGFPQDGPDNGGSPPELIAAAARALREKSNQYPPGAGLPELRDAICAYYRRVQGLDLTRDRVIVTSGATEGIAVSLLALVRPGDEVIMFQPAYDAYAPLVRRAGGVPVMVNLMPPDWRLDARALAGAINARTRAVVLNDPLNPSGSVADEAELAAIAGLCAAHDLIAICDEVWEAVRFDGAAHRSLMTFPEMARRTVKIGSAGKIFGLTGWKIGWLVAAPELASGLARAHQFVTYSSPPALQWAVAEGLRLPAQWFAARDARWARSRARLAEGLTRAGYAVLPSAATWFLCIDLAASGVTLDDRTFSERAIREAGVASIPVSPFYEGAGPTGVVRFCYTKDDAMLDEACARLGSFRESLLAQS